jgi:hypothetical protein
VYYSGTAKECEGKSRAVSAEATNDGERRMTEAEWLHCGDPELMLTFLKPRLTERKVRLHACACCRVIWHLFPDERGRLAVETAERLADGLASGEEADRLSEELRLKAAPTSMVGRLAERAASLALSRDGMMTRAWSYVVIASEGQSSPSGTFLSRFALHSNAPFAELLSEIVGNPFHDVQLAPSVFAALDGIVVKLAQSIYEEKAFDRLPILADALEEAGCADEALLSHLRSSGPHVRGCWAVDLVLGKS